MIEMKKLARTNKFICFLLVGCLLAPTFLLGQDEEEETPAEKQSAKEKLQSISIGGLDANPSKTLEHIEVLVSTGKIDNETFAKAIVAIIPNEDKVEAYVEELKASGKVPAAVINEVIEEITNIEVPGQPPAGVPPTTPPQLPDDSYSYDTNTDTLSIDLLATPPQYLEGSDITEANLLDKGIDDLMTRQTIPYLVDAYELGNFSGSSHSARFNDILLEAVKLANVLIKSLEMTDQLDIAGSDNLFDKDRLTKILDNRNPYFHQLVRALANRGAFGDKSDGKVGVAIEKLITSLFPSGVSTNEISEVLSKTMKEIVFEQLNNGDLGGLIDLSDFKNSSLFDINVDQVKGIVAQDIHLGSASGSTSIDLTDQLKTSNTPTDPKNWKVFGIGAGKDIIVKGNVSFKNSNNRDPQTDEVLRPQVKDHALAIGALDEIHFHSRTIYDSGEGSAEADWGLPADFLEKHLNYEDKVMPTTSWSDSTEPQNIKRIKMDFEGANLYLGSISKMELVNVDLESGGNLGVASLDELHIVSSDPTDTPNTFTVGKNTNPSDRGDNVQLFANERIVADGLRFEGRVDSIYMEARTVDLKNVTFPNGSEVNLASDLGGVGANGTGNGKYPTFGIGQREIGRVNFIKNVNYNTTSDGNPINMISDSAFNTVNSTVILPNGKQAVTISKR